MKSDQVVQHNLLLLFNSIINFIINAGVGANKVKTKELKHHDLQHHYVVKL